MTKPFFRLPVRLGLDAGMALLFVTSLAFRITGRAPHEWVGLTLCVLFGVHTVINRLWYARLLMGNYSLRRVLNTITNLTLATAMLTLCVTGILNSRHIFGFSHYVDGESIRRLHSFAAYWGLALIGAHAGLHGEMILGALQKALGKGLERQGTALALRGCAALITIYGVWAFFDRDMDSKLFQGFAFDFWSPDRLTVFFFTDNLAIFGMYAVVTHYALKGMKTAARKCRAVPAELTPRA